MTCTSTWCSTGDGGSARRRTLVWCGSDVHAHRHRQAQRRQSAGLARRRPRPDRRNTAEPARRTPPVELKIRLAAELSAPLLAELEHWMKIERARLSRHSPAAKAMDHVLRRRAPFTRHSQAVHPLAAAPTSIQFLAGAPPRARIDRSAAQRLGTVIIKFL